MDPIENHRPALLMATFFSDRRCKENHPCKREGESGNAEGCDIHDLTPTSPREFGGFRP